MKTLLLMRHAKSSWKQLSLADHDRPLNKRGKRDAPEMGDLMRKMQLVPHLVLSSTARRARDTARLVADACHYSGEIETHRDLYLSDTTCYLDILRCLPDEVNLVLVVGHNPDMEELLTLLTGNTERLPTCALAQVELPITSWVNLNEATDGRLQNLWLPQNP